jgi:hypothetical protein
MAKRIVKVSARPPSYPGDMHVLVTCSCGSNTGFHYDQVNMGGPAFICQGCRTGYFDVPEAGYGGGAAHYG